MSASNQKTIRIVKKGNTIANMDKAAKDLDAGSFKMWCYFMRYENGSEFDLSGKVVEKEFGVKKAQYDAAISKLIEKNYLINTHKNIFYFLENPLI